LVKNGFLRFGPPLGNPSAKRGWLFGDPYKLTYTIFFRAIKNYKKFFFTVLGLLFGILYFYKYEEKERKKWKRKRKENLGIYSEIKYPLM
jgi:hypothetical protein